MKKLIDTVAYMWLALTVIVIGVKAYEKLDEHSRRPLFDQSYLKNLQYEMLKK